MWFSFLSIYSISLCPIVHTSSKVIFIKFIIWTISFFYLKSYNDFLYYTEKKKSYNDFLYYTEKKKSKSFLTACMIWSCLTILPYFLLVPLILSLTAQAFRLYLKHFELCFLGLQCDFLRCSLCCLLQLNIKVSN